MVVERSSFQTRRLVVAGWHDAEPDHEALAEVVAGMLTAAVTAALPPGWQGPYDRERARRWISDRDAEGTNLLVKEAAASVGLVLLHEEPAGDGLSVRLGYLLAEGAWGRGLGGELVGGLVDWCRTQPSVRSLVGGVAEDNIASIRILERNGFTPADGGSTAVDEREYRLEL